MEQLDMFDESNKPSVKEALNRVLIKRKQRRIKVKARIANKPSNMRSVQKKVLEDAIARLKAANCAFKIVTPDNDEIIHDPNKVLDKRKQHIDRSDLPYSYGDLKKHYLPYLTGMNVGDVAEIPYTDTLPPLAIQSSLTAHLTNAWGKGNYATTTNKKTKMLEVLRLA